MALGRIAEPASASYCFYQSPARVVAIKSEVQTEETDSPLRGINANPSAGRERGGRVFTILKSRVMNHPSGSLDDLHMNLFAPQPQTHTRPLPPLPTRLRHPANSRPSSPDSVAQARRDSNDYHVGRASSSTASTPNAPSPLNHSVNEDLTTAPSTSLKRGRPAERNFGGSRGPSPHVPVAQSDRYDFSDSLGAAAVAPGTEEKPAKKVRVGARASIACTTCR